MSAERLREAADRLDMLSDVTPLNVTINPRIARPLAAWLREDAECLALAEGYARAQGVYLHPTSDALAFVGPALAVADAILGGAE